MRTCQSKTLKGEPCRAAALSGRDRCLAHSDEITRGKTGFGGVQRGAGRPRSPRAVDVLRERVEADVDRVLDPLFNALEATRSVVVGNGSTAHVQVVEDIPTRLAAARELLNRAYGRPRQVPEVIEITAEMLDNAIAQMEVEVAELERQAAGAVGLEAPSD
jgi:hypothetical protein